MLRIPIPTRGVGSAFRPAFTTPAVLPATHVGEGSISGTISLLSVPERDERRARQPGDDIALGVLDSFQDIG